MSLGHVVVIVRSGHAVVLGLAVIVSLGHVVVIVRSGHAVVLCLAVIVNSRHAVVLCLAVIVSSRHAVFSLALALLLVSSVHVDRCSFSHDVHIAVRLFSRTVLLCSCLLRSIQLFIFYFLFFYSFIPTHTPVPFFSSSYSCSLFLQSI